MFTLFPKDPSCHDCRLTKITRGPYRKRNNSQLHRAEKFGDLVTAEHKVLNEEGQSRNNHKYAVIVQDLATQWIQSYPCKAKTLKRDDEKLAEVPRFESQSDSDSHRKFTGICQSF